MAHGDKERLEKFYRDAFNEFGSMSPHSVHWSDTHNQLTRFEILLGVADVSHASLLDIGCGLEVLYKYLLLKNIPVKYTGIDIVPEFVE